MKIRNKEVLIVGLGISGLASIKTLNRLGAKISIADSKEEEDLEKALKSIGEIKFKQYLGDNIKDLDLARIDLIIKSPGIPPRMELIRKAREANIPIITDIELGYLLAPTDKIISISGTNGKTTTTSLVGEILKEGNLNSFVVGNIGVGILQEIEKVKEDDILLIEASSYQLENTKNFKPRISLLLNISKDHLDWHGSYENYIKAKKKIFKNQDKDDYIVLNYDDEIIRSFSKEIEARIIWFSLDRKLDKGIYLDGENIIINNGRKKIKLMERSEVKILGRHNLENILGSIGIAYALALDPKIVKKAIKNFKGVEHRLEFVQEKKGVTYYNDSKGTNVGSSIKAIEAIDNPIILIAGGYDENSEFDNLIKSLNKVKALILLGETKEKIRETAINYGFEKYYLVEDMKEAVELAYKLSSKGDSILLSPACASWDMYTSFEARGHDFKRLVLNLREE